MAHPFLKEKPCERGRSVFRSAPSSFTVFAFSWLILPNYGGGEFGGGDKDNDYDDGDDDVEDYDDDDDDDDDSVDDEEDDFHNHQNCSVLSSD